LQDSAVSCRRTVRPALAGQTIRVRFPRFVPARQSHPLAPSDACAKTALSVPVRFEADHPGLNDRRGQ
jgi:hypothetical protein